MNTVFEYTCYRQYIGDAIIEKNIKGTDVARALQLKSKSYLGLILRGQKKLQSDQVHSFKDILELSSHEFDYFYHLVFFCDAGNKESRHYHKSKMESLKPSQSGKILKTEHGKETVLTHWYYPALLLYSSLVHRESLQKLSGSLGIKIEELNSALHNLKQLGLLKKSADGSWSAETAKLKIAKKSWNSIQRQFLKSQIQNALNSFDKNYEKNGKYYSQTITFSKESFDEIWKLIKDNMDNLADRSDMEAAEELLQLNVQFYRLA